MLTKFHPDDRRTRVFLTYKCGFYRHIAYEILTEYGEKLGFVKGKNPNPFYKNTGIHIQANFQEFKDWLNSVEIVRKYNNPNNKYPKGYKRKERQMDGYDEWWQQSNLDGSFAYNNVTDDF